MTEGEILSKQSVSISGEHKAHSHIEVENHQEPVAMGLGQEKKNDS